MQNFNHRKDEGLAGVLIPKIKERNGKNSNLISRTPKYFGIDLVWTPIDKYLFSDSDFEHRHITLLMLVYTAKKAKVLLLV